MVSYFFDRRDIIDALKQDRKPRHEELPVATSSFAPLSSIPHSNIASTTTENYVANFFASGAMHVHLPAKEPSFQSNQDKLPSQPLETFQEGLLSSNKKEGKRKVLVRLFLRASLEANLRLHMQNHLSNGLASSSKADPPLPSANSTSVVLEHKAKMRENERDNYHSDAKLKEVRRTCIFFVPPFHAISILFLCSRQACPLGDRSPDRRSISRSQAMLSPTFLCPPSLLQTQFHLLKSYVLDKTHQMRTTHQSLQK